MKSLSPEELWKLMAIMERATGSSFDGERLAALKLVQQLFASRGLLWRELLHAERTPRRALGRCAMTLALELLVDVEPRVTMP